MVSGEWNRRRAPVTLSGVPTPMRSVRAFLLPVAIVAACEHTAPFGALELDSLGPAAPGLPRRLTFNTGDDRNPRSPAA